MKKKEKIKLNLNLYSYGYSLNFLNLKIKKTNLIELINKHKLLELNGIELPIDTYLNRFLNLKNFTNYLHRDINSMYVLIILKI